MIGIIYKYTSPSGKSYIGQDSKPGHRYKTFLDTSKIYTALNSKIDNAKLKYGPEKFKVSILRVVEANDKIELRDKLNKLEIFYISFYDTYNNGYNLTLGGGGTLGMILTDEQRKKMSIAFKGRKSSFKGKKHSEKTKEILSNSKKGIYAGEKNPFYNKKHTDEVKQLISDKANKRMCDELKQRMRDAKSEKCKSIIAIFIESNEIYEFQSLHLAEKFTDVRRHHIKAAIISGKIKKGFLFKFKEGSTTITEV